MPGSLTRICASLGLRMKFKTLFMSGEEKFGHNFDLPLFFNMSKQFLAPYILGFECIQDVLCKPGASRKLRSSKFSKLIFGNIIVVIGTTFFKFV